MKSKSFLFVICLLFFSCTRDNGSSPEASPESPTSPVTPTTDPAAPVKEKFGRVRGTISLQLFKRLVFSEAIAADVDYSKCKSLCDSTKEICLELKWIKEDGSSEVLCKSSLVPPVPGDLGLGSFSFDLEVNWAKDKLFSVQLNHPTKGPREIVFKHNGSELIQEGISPITTFIAKLHEVLRKTSSHRVSALDPQQFFSKFNQNKINEILVSMKLSSSVASAEKQLEDFLKFMPEAFFEKIQASAAAVYDAVINDLSLDGLPKFPTLAQDLATNKDNVNDDDKDGVVNANDCSPEDSTKMHLVSHLSADSDGDGRRINQSGLSCVGESKALPNGYFSTAVALQDADCDDGNSSLWKTLTFMSRDIDLDGWSVFVGSAELCTNGSLPATYVSSKPTTNDCAPDDPTKWQNYKLFVDLDGDKRVSVLNSGGITLCLGNTIPAGYVSDTKRDSRGTALFDCDDTNPLLHTIGTAYLDKDKDGYGAGSFLSVCAFGDSSTPLPGFSLATNDCDDNDATKIRLLDFKFVDIDGDGRFIPSVGKLCTGNSLPKSHVFNDLSGYSSDCDDQNKAVFQLLDYMYTDIDGDGHTVSFVPPSKICSGDQLLPGYHRTLDTVTNFSSGADCDDKNPEVFGFIDAYIDSDNDSLLGLNPVKLCGGANLPSGYSRTKPTIGDCDDTNANIGTKLITLDPRSKVGDVKDFSFTRVLPDHNSLFLSKVFHLNGSSEFEFYYRQAGALMQRRIKLSQNSCEPELVTPILNAGYGNVPIKLEFSSQGTLFYLTNYNPDLGTTDSVLRKVSMATGMTVREFDGNRKMLDAIVLGNKIYMIYNDGNLRTSIFVLNSETDEVVLDENLDDKNGLSFGGAKLVVSENGKIWAFYATDVEFSTKVYAAMIDLGMDVRQSYVVGENLPGLSPSVLNGMFSFVYRKNSLSSYPESPYVNILQRTVVQNLDCVGLPFCQGTTLDTSATQLLSLTQSNPILVEKVIEGLRK